MTKPKKPKKKPTKNWPQVPAAGGGTQDRSRNPKSGKIRAKRKDAKGK